MVSKIPFLIKNNINLGILGVANGVAYFILRSGLCSASAWWPLALQEIIVFFFHRNLLSALYRGLVASGTPGNHSFFFHTNLSLGMLDFTGLDHWALFNFS